jgi:hypothetical protein
MPAPTIRTLNFGLSSRLEYGYTEEYEGVVDMEDSVVGSVDLALEEVD